MRLDTTPCGFCGRTQAGWYEGRLSLLEWDRQSYSAFDVQLFKGFPICGMCCEQIARTRVRPCVLRDYAKARDGAARLLRAAAAKVKPPP